eukprot:124662-Amorphochlora_amoeboformis.AAC.1
MSRWIVTVSREILRTELINLSLNADALGYSLDAEYINFYRFSPQICEGVGQIMPLSFTPMQKQELATSYACMILGDCDLKVSFHYKIVFRALAFLGGEGWIGNWFWELWAKGRLGM